jgi:hypothetical protein
MHFSSHTCRLHHARAQTPFIGKAAVRAFIEEFDFPGIKFIPEKFSEVRILNLRAHTNCVSGCRCRCQMCIS